MCLIMTSSAYQGISRHTNKVPRQVASPKDKTTFHINTGTNNNKTLNKTKSVHVLKLTTSSDAKRLRTNQSFLCERGNGS